MAAAATAETEALARCAAIGEPTARLACYDVLAARPPSAAASAATAPASPALATAATGPAEAPAPRATAVPASTPQRFGLNKAAPRAAPAEAASIEAVVASITQNRLGQSQVLLDNGQTWVSAEIGLRIAAGDKVTVKRATFGSYMMLTSSRSSYRVRRVN